MKPHQNQWFCRLGRFVACILMLLSPRAALAQQMQWKPLTGILDYQMTGHYGTQGVPSPDNHAGARAGAATWTGADGKLYLFGGSGYGQGGIGGYLNDLWRFDPASGHWTWLKGSQATDQAGIYGTQGLAAAANIPGARSGAATWTGADGKFYLFGGDGYDTKRNFGRLNDLWRFDPASGNWTWLKGSQEGQQPGVYGTQGLAAAANTPGARAGATAWTTTDGKFYLFGGDGYDTKRNFGHLNDLWRFDPASGNWTWLKGSQELNQPGIYGAQGLADAANTPGARVNATAWTGADGKLYLFGGSITININYDKYFNDLWCFDPASGNWTWIKGSQFTSQPGVYGTQGLAAANTPGARQGASAWTTPGGKFYLFGGDGYDCGGYYNYLGDLWCCEGAAVHSSAHAWRDYR